MTRADRYADAACLNHWPDLWHCDHPEDTAIAVAICRTCPVRQMCLDDALTEEDGVGAGYRYGIRGALTPTQRSRLDHRYGSHAQRITANDARSDQVDDLLTRRPDLNPKQAATIVANRDGVRPDNVYSSWQRWTRRQGKIA